MDLLLTYGAHPDCDALGYAVFNGDEAIVKRLLDAGADPEAVVLPWNKPVLDLARSIIMPSHMGNTATIIALIEGALAKKHGLS